MRFSGVAAKTKTKQNKGSYNRTLRLVYAALLTSVCIVVNSFEINLVTHKMSFVYIPTFFAGVILGPLGGGLVGGLGDIIGFMLRPSGVYNPIFTFSNMLLGFLPGLTFKYLKLNPIINTAISFLLVYLLCTLLINSSAIYILYLASSSRTFSAYFFSRILSQTPIVAINLAACMLLYHPVKRIVRL